jgi:DNA recombination protein RmuC
MGDSLKNSSHIAEVSNKNIEAITKKLTELWETNREIKDIGDRLEGLESILKNPKRRWNLWEYFLGELLENVFSPGQYKLQYSFSSWIVDAALFIGKKIIPIDSKFPQENYQYLIQSDDEFSVKKILCRT